MPTVSVKWQKQVFTGVEIDTEQVPYVFKCQLYDLTGVPPERQKITVKGGLLKDDGDWENLGVKEGQRLMLMGTADEIPKAPEKGPVFIEDLPEDEQGTAALGHTAGLVNLGNTCYMNSTVQCLHSVPELRLALKEYSAAVGTGIDPLLHSLTAATRDLFGELDKSLRPVAPIHFLTVLRKKYPQFAQQTNHGLYMQQDAEECWTQLLYVLSQRLQSVPQDEEEATNPVVKHLFGIELKSIIKCAESAEESSESETVYTLKCHISSEVNHLHEGLKQGLKSELEKTSPILGHSTLHVKESHINKLPPYLTVQFVRFFWKRESNQKAKILRKVGYPLVLDVFDFCTEELRDKLKGPRKVYQETEDAKVGLKKKEKEGAEGMKALQNLGTSTSDENVEMVDDAGRHPSSSEKVCAPEPEVTGIYDLVAVLTHKGRSADSGHYVAWVKQDSGKWIEFDDEQPILQKEEDITKLSGGGDWHMAYICLYKARVALPH
ncbi:hypothetical protein BDL97_11G025000 [Sphagnum fallax]|nr:hypothetical protein BDL97_11G025000 [Sphagnum fallax]KAH8947147.1 hypothetical protein BDL97_11G025000 [Sphagnum fallax]